MPRILITGVSSFVGLELANHFQRKGYEVFGTISNEMKSYSGIKKDRLQSINKTNFTLLRLNLDQYDDVRRVASSIKPDFWINHAAWTELATSSRFDIRKAAETNFFGLDALFSTLKENQCKGIILTGSNAEYPNKEGALTEDLIGIPETPYGQSKLMATMRAKILSNEFELPCFVLRLFNPIGKYDNPKKLIPTALTHLNNDLEISLSACDQKRDFTSVSNVATAFDAAISNLVRISGFEIFNICQGQPTILKDLLLKFCQNDPEKERLLKFGLIPKRTQEPDVNYGLIKKANNLLNWSPQIAINTAELLEHYDK